MYLGNTVKIDRFDGEYLEVSQHWLMDIVWDKYNMSLKEFLASYDRRDSDYILTLADRNRAYYELKNDDSHLSN
ncbi:hypothetical protein A374_08039 [Fictibacillus macauensis ZFHKF-1]|uniref:Uncharacterized protein n=1 Tax=Fictibacillus macauensis ZFHKF-1 TaxID=1196324 RepID=I8AJQ3_9BACL|nr:hypothetical protein [Fictibacillus macauensis]EIT85769.1 hypothetical protein A374_08039 [Fictibacillus macauensis ZFHKF-1]